MAQTGVSESSVGGVLGELRARTRELHTRAERHPVQASLVQGRTDRAGYASYLSQMLCIHRALEAELSRRLGSEALAPVEPSQFRAGAIEADLAWLGAEAEPPVEPVARFAAGVVYESDEALLGMHYVLEGSTNGGRFIASAVRRGLGLEGNEGVRYLDPYGDAQRARWAAFCEALGLTPLDGAAQESVVAGAESMFRLIIDTFDAMDSRAMAPA